MPRYGAKLRRPDQPVLHLGHYLSQASALPAPPPTVDYASAGIVWPAYGNLAYNCCVTAAQWHQVNLWQRFALGSQTVPQDQLGVDYYFKETGGADSGLDTARALNYWSLNPINGSKLNAWAIINPKDAFQVKFTMFNFGGCIATLLLPMMAEVWWKNGEIWADTVSAANLAHDVLIVYYDAQIVKCITWGSVQTMTWAFFLARVHDVYCCIGQDWVSKSPTPSGMAVADLLADFQTLIHPPPPPPPAPSPLLPGNFDVTDGILNINGVPTRVNGWLDVRQGK